MAPSALLVKFRCYSLFLLMGDSLITVLLTDSMCSGSGVAMGRFGNGAVVVR